MDIKEAEIIANAMIKAAEKSGEKIADGIRAGFHETAMELNKSLSGTKAELMLKLLTKKSQADILLK